MEKTASGGVSVLVEKLGEGELNHGRWIS